MKRRKVFQFNTELFKVTGIQRVLLDIHEALKEEFDVKIVGNLPFDKVNRSLDISEDDYVRFKTPLMFRNSVVIIHERRLLPLMWLIIHIPWFNVKCVYIHHSVLYGHKLLSLFPKNIVAISDSGIKNLTENFNIARKNITKIHNCVRETFPYHPRPRKFNPNDITILYPARINSIKRQIDIVNKLNGKLDPRVKILFAGDGPLLEEFKKICDGNEQFKPLGFRDDILDLMQQCDFMLLFSKTEGLPISLIESIKSGLPAICNNVGGNSEIIEDGKNGYIVQSWEELETLLNSLPNKTTEEILSLGLNGRKSYKDFSFNIFKSNYINYIKQIMK